jgi:hypothetical protein
MLLDHGFANAIHIGLQLWEGESGLDAAHDFKPMATAAVFAQIVG